jgi:chromosome partitioning protein
LKGGVGKTMTAASLGAGLAREGRRVLCVDADPQHSLTVSFGVAEPQELRNTLAAAMMNVINEDGPEPPEVISDCWEGVDLLPANSSLAGIELALAPLIGRETVLKQYIGMVKPLYDYILIDTPPTLDLLTVNALAAADSVIIPIAPKFLDAKGLELLLRSIAQIKRHINPTLAISGLVLTMVEKRARLTKEVISSIEAAYGKNIRIFRERVPRSVRAAETSAQGVSIFRHEPGGKVAAAYESLVREAISAPACTAWKNLTTRISKRFISGAMHNKQKNRGIFMRLHKEQAALAASVSLLRYIRITNPADLENIFGGWRLRSRPTVEIGKNSLWN